MRRSHHQHNKTKHLSATDGCSTKLEDPIDVTTTTNATATRTVASPPGYPPFLPRVLSPHASIRDSYHSYPKDERPLRPTGSYIRSRDRTQREHRTLLKNKLLLLYCHFNTIRRMRCPTAKTSWSGRQSMCFSRIASGGVMPKLPCPFLMSPKAAGSMMKYYITAVYTTSG